MRQETLPRDRVLNGFVRNDSLRRITIEAKDVRAVDEDGNALQRPGDLHPRATSIRSTRRRARRPAGCPIRSGSGSASCVRLEPGKKTHLSVAWRLAPGDKPPVRDRLRRSDRCSIPGS